MANLYVQSIGCPALSYLPAFGLDWQEDHAFMVELVYEVARRKTFEHSRFLFLLQSLPLHPLEKQKAALLRFSLKITNLPIADLQLLEWDLVQDKKKILQCWKHTARQNPKRVIDQIQHFPYGKAEKIALAKQCAKSADAEALLPKLPLFDLHTNTDQNSLFEIAVLLSMNSNYRASAAQILQALDLQVDMKKRDVLHLIHLALKKHSRATGAPLKVSGGAFDLKIPLEAKLQECKSQDWFSTVKELTENAFLFLEAFEPFFTAYLLEAFYKSSIAARKRTDAAGMAYVAESTQQKISREFADEILRILLNAINTPNRKVKADVLPLLFLPLLCSLTGKDPESLGQVLKNFNVCIKNAPAQTLMIRLYLFGIFPAQKEIKSMSLRIDKLFRGLDKANKIDLTRSLLGFFQLLYANVEFNDKRKWKLVQTVFSNEFLEQISQGNRQNLAEQAKNLQKRILFARLILQCSFFNDYLHYKELPSINEYVEQKVLELLPNGLIPQEIRMLQHFWIDSREKVAEGFFSYCGSLSDLSPDDQTKLLPLWKDYLLTAAQGLEIYQSWKNETSAKSVHWQTLSKYPQILSAWKNIVSVEKTLSAFSTQKPDYWSIFCQKIVQDAHLRGVEHLYTYLTEGKNTMPFLPFDVYSPNLQFQQKAMEFLTLYARDKIHTPQECKRHLETLKNLLAQFAPQAEFMNDLQGLITSLQRDRKSNQVTSLVTDDPLYLFRMSYEVSGSCQRPDGDANLNKCLLGYLCNPHIKAVILEDSTKTLQARAVIKLLIREKSDEKRDEVEPVVFLERPYPSHISFEEVELLWEMAKSFADSLQIPLMANDESYNKVQPARIVHNQVTLTCKGGVAPYEYSDANKKVTKGNYTISNAFYWMNETTKEI